MNQWIATAKNQNRSLLEPEANQLFADYGLPVPACRLVASRQGAVQAANEIGLPVVLKIVSPDILHKSDAGGVKVKLQSEADVAEAYDAIMQNVAAYNPDAAITGMLVTQMLQPGLECIVGMTRDASFGPALMFGLGGIFVEVLKDVSFRVLPFGKADALAMIGELKAAPLLTGVRGQQPLDVDAVAELLVKVARMVEENPEIQELDINPCFVYQSGVMVADARVML